MPVALGARVPTRAPPVEFDRSIVFVRRGVVDVDPQQVISQALRQLRLGDSEMLESNRPIARV